MPINTTEMMRLTDTPETRKRLAEIYARWEAMTPEERKADDAKEARRNEELKRHLAWLDWCVANKTDPNLVR